MSHILSKNMHISRNENTVKRDLFEGNIVPCLIALSWPVLISQCLNVFGPIIDLIWVGKLGSDAVAGVGIAGIISMVAMVAMYGFVSGVRALIARLMGTNDTKNANHAALQAYVMSLSLYVIIAIIGILFAEVILNFFRLEAEVVTEGAAYLRIMFIGAIFQSLWLISESTMQASGDTLTPMRIAVFVRLLHLGLCPILIFGWWIFPVLGVRGAAVSNAVSMGLGLALSLWILFSGRTRVRLTLNKYHLDLNIIWRMVKVGLPNLFMHIQHHIFILMLLKLITPFGTVAVVAHAIWFRTDTIIIILGMSVGIGAGVMAAQNLGANQPERARKVGWIGAYITLLVMLVTLIIVVVWAEVIAGIFNNELDVLRVTSSFLRIAATSYLAAGLNNIFMVFLITTGNTFPALLLEMAHTWGVQLPLAFLLTRYTDMGIYGMRWAMVIGLLVAGVIFTLYFWKGNWASKEV